MLSISESNLWVMLHRARMALRRCLETNWATAGMSESKKPKVIVRISTVTCPPCCLRRGMCWRNRLGRYWFASAKQYEIAPITLSKPSGPKGFESVMGPIHIVLRWRTSNVRVGCASTSASNTAPPAGSSGRRWKSLQLLSVFLIHSFRRVLFLKPSSFPGSGARPCGRDATSPKDCSRKCSAWRKSPCSRRRQPPAR